MRQVAVSAGVRLRPEGDPASASKSIGSVKLRSSSGVSQIALSIGAGSYEINATCQESVSNKLVDRFEIGGIVSFRVHVGHSPVIVG
jgi:hypothetical protein